MGENLKIVPNNINPPNVPMHTRNSQLDDWEFRVCLALQVYEGGWEANTEQLLIRRIECKMKELDKNFVESL